MKFDETNMGGEQRTFAETAHDMVVGLRNPGGPDYKKAFDDFCRRYWKPVYAYIRASWGKGNEESKDLTQAFFLWLAEGDALRKFEPERGSLRRFLRVLLRSFIGHDEVALARLKRGGGTRVVSLDAGAAELENLVPDPRSPDPEANYERVWRHTVLQHAVHNLRNDCAARGRVPDFLLFADYDLLPEPVRPTYKELAARYQVDEAEVKKRLVDMRDRLRREVRAELARVTMHDQAIDDEWTVLFGG
jgi:DNA-directed RNA polymerase specialized sigma24 family protein